LERRLQRSFFERYTPRVARELLGKTLVRKLGAVELSGIIVEVEAYRGLDDPASHAHRGLTKRNAVMFGRGGFAYVYLSYGNNFCLNVVTENEGRPGAVLIRALHPVEGIKSMKKNRGVSTEIELTNGPGKLTQALKIDRELNGEDLITSRKLYILNLEKSSFNISVSTRIGIGVGTDKRWRYFVKGNQFVSRGKPSHSFRVDSQKA
jgi:DNA-3-methyladenine glycosylase